MLSTQQSANVELKQKIREYTSLFVREVEKAKSNAIYNRFSKFEKDLKEINEGSWFIYFDLTEKQIDMMDEGGLGWFVADDYMHIQVDTVLHRPKEVALSLLESDYMDERNYKNIIETRIDIIKSAVIKHLSNSLINQMRFDVNTYTESINESKYEHYKTVSDKFLNNKANYHAGDRQRPIARSLRAHKSSPKRKSGIAQLENSVRRMF